MSGLVGCFQHAVVSTYNKWYKEGQLLNWRKGHGHSELNDVYGEQKLACLFWFQRKATDAQMLRKILLAVMERCQKKQCITACFVWRCRRHRCTMEGKQVCRDNAMLWVMFCWKTLGPKNHVVFFLTHTTYLNMPTKYNLVFKAIKYCLDV